MVWASTKQEIPVKKPKYIDYRSYTLFNRDLFVEDMSVIPFQVAEIFDNHQKMTHTGYVLRSSKEL